MLYAISSYFLFYILALQLRQKERPWLTWVSAQSFLIYLMHPLMLSLLIISANKIGHPGIWAGNRGLLALFFCTTLSTLFMTYLVSRTPIAAMLGGVKAKYL
jgi:surface polysaccharide O-acyltransferase-like enzyme